MDQTGVAGLTILITIVLTLIFFFQLFWIQSNTKKTNKLLARMLNEMNKERFVLPEVGDEMSDLEQKDNIKF